MRLIEELDAYQMPLYPLKSHHGADIAALCQPNVAFAVVRSSDGQAVGCGAVVLGEEYGELKRMYVRPGSRVLVQTAAQGYLAATSRNAGPTTFRSTA